MSGFVGQRADRHDGRGVACAVAAASTLHGVAIDLQELTRVSGPRSTGDIGRAAMPAPDEESMSPDVGGGGTGSIQLGLEKGDKVNHPIIITRVGYSVPTIVVETVPDRCSISPVRNGVQGSQQELTKAADHANRTG